MALTGTDGVSKVIIGVWRLHDCDVADCVDDGVAIWSDGYGGVGAEGEGFTAADGVVVAADGVFPAPVGVVVWV